MARRQFDVDGGRPESAPQIHHPEPDVVVDVGQGPWKLRVGTDLIVQARVSVVIPVLNEAGSLAHVLGELPPNLHQVIVVDGGSTDDTIAVARQALPGVQIVNQVGRGKGDALRCGFEAVTGDIVVMLDGDGSMRGGEITRFVRALAHANFAKGSRFLPGGGTTDLTPFRRFGNWFLRGVFNGTFGTRYSDLCYGYNAFWSRYLENVMPECEGFEVETFMAARATRAGLTVTEVPSFEDDRLAGASKLRSIKDGFRILRVIRDERKLPVAPPRRIESEPLPQAADG